MDQRRMLRLLDHSELQLGLGLLVVESLVESVTEVLVRRKGEKEKYRKTLVNNCDTLSKKSNVSLTGKQTWGGGRRACA